MEQIDFSSYLFFDYIAKDPFTSCKFQKVYVSDKENVLKFFTGKRYESICALIFSLSEVCVKKVFINSKLDILQIYNTNSGTITDLYAHKKCV